MGGGVSGTVWRQGAGANRRMTVVKLINVKEGQWMNVRIRECTNVKLCSVCE